VGAAVGWAQALKVNITTSTIERIPYSFFISFSFLMSQLTEDHFCGLKNSVASFRNR
jgi:hypothetical protein